VIALREREHELGQLRAALGEVREGKGCAVVLEGDAGLGKTRLLSEIRQAAGDAGLTVLSARATDLERDFPFALVRQLFETRISALPAAEREALLDGASAVRGALGLQPEDRSHDSFAVLHGLYWVTAAFAEKEPLLLAIDDAHTADAASLDYLGFLLPRLEELPVLLVVAARTHEPNPPEELDRVLTDPAARHLTLATLSAEAATAALAEELGREPEPAFATACCEVTGGNPFLLCELGRTLVEQQIEPISRQADVVRQLAPERVARMVLSRLSRLSSRAATFARALAVLGEAGDPRLVAELAEIGADEARHVADELRDNAILDSVPPLRFTHPLVRNAIYLDVPIGDRQSAHARAASLLRAGGAAPERVATQLLASEARGDRAAVETLVEAGERALSDGAPRSAIAYLTRALAEPPAVEGRAAVLSPLITATLRTADHSVFPAIEEEVFAEWRRDPSLRSRWAIELTMWMAFGEGRFDEAISMQREGIEVALAEGDMESAFRLVSQLRMFALLMPPGLAANLEAPLADYAKETDPDSLGGRLVAAMEAIHALGSGAAEAAAEAAKRALGDDSLLFAEEPEFLVSIMVVLALGSADELDAARDGAERALAIALERDATPDLVRGWCLRGMIGWGAGELAAAVADMRQAIDLARLAGIAPVIPLLSTTPLVEMMIERDELEGAEGELRLWGIADAPIPDQPVFGPLRSARGRLRLERGELDQAAEDFAHLGVDLEGLPLGPGLIAAASPYAARALVAVGESAKARELTGEIEVHARRWGAPAAVAAALRGVAAAKEEDEGVELLEEAVATLGDSQWRLHRAHTLVDLGAALRRSERGAEAREPLREGLHFARQCGAIRLARLAHHELEASGGTVRRYTPIGVESLTPSERRVAELAASGMTNRQIAQSLFVTVKTVEAHLSAAYDKLDISSRRQLAGALAGSPR